MKIRPRQRRCRFQLKIYSYGGHYYTDRIAKLEAAIARKPHVLEIELIGAGEIPADCALLIRSVLRARSPKTRLDTVARSSLQNGSVLVWLMGERRLIRDDARVFFKRAALSAISEVDPDELGKDSAPKASDWSDDIDPEDADHAAVLERINEFLPIKELAGRIIGVPLLRQFGLVESEKLDDFLANAFATRREATDAPRQVTVEKPFGRTGKQPRSRLVGS